MLFLLEHDLRYSLQHASAGAGVFNPGVNDPVPVELQGRIVRFALFPLHQFSKFNE